MIGLKCIIYIYIHQNKKNIITIRVQCVHIISLLGIL